MGRSQVEAGEQKKLAQWLDLRFPGWWWHTPNGGQRQRFEATNLKKEGVKPGVPDVLIVAPFKVPGERLYVGAAIELKATYERNDRRPNAKPTQKLWLLLLKWAGFYTRVCWGADEAIELLARLYSDTPLPDTNARRLRVCWTCLGEFHPRTPSTYKHRCLRAGKDTCHGTIKEFHDAASVVTACAPTEAQLAARERRIAKVKKERRAARGGDVTERVSARELLERLSK